MLLVNISGVNIVLETLCTIFFPPNRLQILCTVRQRGREKERVQEKEIERLQENVCARKRETERREGGRQEGKSVM